MDRGAPKSCPKKCDEAFPFEVRIGRERILELAFPHGDERHARGVSEKRDHDGFVGEPYR